ncbi:MAG TPA: AAA family ATPase, partial [Rubrivivax sp.]|nr:AAA family ATPase [Rubrivivax sp.]
MSRKDAALLAVLALDGTCARDTLAQMLWPDADPSRARASLRQRRFRLARTAGRPVLDGDEMLRLAVGIRHPAADADGLLGADPAALDGELLEGLDFADCPALDHWLQLARERWQVLRAHALARLASRLEDTAQLAAALSVARRLAADEPLSDHAARRLMRLHHRRGDLGAALDAYRRFAGRLDAELGELPDDETATLAASLRQGMALTPRAVPPTLARPPRRIGRDAAWAALEEVQASGRAMLVEGAPGVGKSRLIGDFVAAAAAPGLHVAALAGDAARPYALLARLLSRLWLAPQPLRPEGAAALPGWARRELAVLLPDLGDPVRQVDPLRLLRAVALALHHAGLRLIALDDVQQADAATLELLPALAGEGSEGGERRICWLLGLRAGEAPPALKDWLRASNPPQVLRLTAFDRIQVHELLADLALPGIAGAQWADALARYTGGLPLFVLETLRSLHAMATPALGALPPPDGAAQAVRARANRLPERARQLAHAVSVLAAPMPLQAGSALLGGQPPDWADAFGALESAQWLDAEGRMHDLVAAALRDAMPAAERRWLHSRAGDWLAASGGDPVAAAGHWEAAGMPARAAPLLEEAAERAGRAGRPTEQVALWDRAMACWGRAGRADRRFAAWRESAEPRLFLVGPTRLRPQALARLDEAQDDAQRLDALTVLAETCLVAVDLGSAETAAAEALVLARRLGRPALRVR